MTKKPEQYDFRTYQEHRQLLAETDHASIQCTWREGRDHRGRHIEQHKRIPWICDLQSNLHAGQERENDKHHRPRRYGDYVYPMSMLRPHRGIDTR